MNRFFLTVVPILLIILLFNPINSPYNDWVNKTPEEKANEEAKEAAQKREINRKGFHCLSSWDGSHPVVKKYVEENMRDPDSFEHIETRITPVTEGGMHQLVMKYRAKNGLGGMTVSSAIATVYNASCKATITSIE